MDGGRRRVRAHGALNGRVREIAVDEGRGQAAQFPGGIDAAHSKRRNARNAGCPLAEQTAGCAKASICSERRALAEISEVRRGVPARHRARCGRLRRSEEHTSELQSLMRISYAGFCLKKKNKKKIINKHNNNITKRINN